MKFSDFLHDRKIYQNGYQSQQPGATVVVPTYARNKEGMLTGCIESVLGQTFKNLEFIIVDDGSTDGSEAVIKNFADRDPRIVYVRHEINSGLHAIRMNEAIMLARSPYIAFMFDDNLWYPEALQVMVDTMQAKGADFVHGLVEMPRENDKIVFGTMPPTPELMRLVNTIPNGAVMCSRFFFETVGLYDPHILMRRLCDWDLWMRAYRHGLRCAAVNRVLGVERGVISPTSLGNTILLDYKVSLSYMSDTDRNGERSAALRTECIPDYDVFDTEKLMPFVRDQSEWEKLAASIYEPFFKAHPAYKFTLPLRNNRRFDRALNGYRINAVMPLFKHRKRILIITNRFTRLVQDWVDALSHDPDNIVVVTTEWSWTLFSAEEIDQLILIDGEIESLVPFMDECHSRGVPVINVIVHGIDEPFHGDRDPLAGLDLTRNQGILDQFNGKEDYFGLPGVPWFPAHYDDQRALLEDCDHLVLLNGALKSPLLDGLSPLKLDFIPNQLPEEEAPEDADYSLMLYLADGEQLSASSQQAADDLLSNAPPGARWTVWLLPGNSLPESLKKHAGRLRVLESLETLPSLVLRTRRAFWAVPPEILARYSDYHRLLLEEDLARLHSSIAGLSSPDLPESLTVEKLDQAACSLREKVRERGLGYRSDARFLQMLNITRGVALRKKIAGLAQKSFAHSVNSLVLINSQALAGSEVYGLLVDKALNNIGFNIQAVTHTSFNPYPPGIKNINDWLSARDLKSIIKAEYGKVSRSIAGPVISEADLQKYSDHMRDWLDDLGIDLVFSSGFISEPIVGWSKRRLFFMALFAPLDSYVDRMTYLRYRVDGLVSDTSWAINLWKRWMPPPVSCVPSLVERDYFTIRNRHLPPKPVCIALAGTLQPRKRQLEALEAIRNLVREGYDLHVNVYGYDAFGFEDYIARIRELAAEPILKHRVKFHGFVDDPMEIPRDNHIVFVPSTDESLPQVLLFNQASGLIAVACPAGGISEAVQDGVTGFLAKGFSVEDCTVVMRSALDHRSDWPQISRQARQMVLDRCSEQIFTYQLLDVMLRGAEINLSEGRRYFYKSSGRQDVEAAHAGASTGHPAHQLSSMYDMDVSRLAIGPDVNAVPLHYLLVSEEDGFSGFHFRVGTFSTRPAGSLYLAVTASATSLPLREVKLDLSRITDNTWVKVEFDPIHNSHDQKYSVAIRGDVTAGRFALYECLPSSRKKLHQVILKGNRGLRQFVNLPLVRSFPTLYPIYKED